MATATSTEWKDNGTAAARVDLVNETEMLEMGEPPGRPDSLSKANNAGIAPQGEEIFLPSSEQRAPSLSVIIPGPQELNSDEPLSPTRGGHRVAPIPTSPLASPTEAKPKRATSKYYKKQNEFIENIKSDNEQIQRLRSQKKVPKAAWTEATAEEQAPFSEQSPDGKTDANELRARKFNDANATNDEPSLKVVVVNEGGDKPVDGKDRTKQAPMTYEKSLKAAARFAKITLAVNVFLMFSKAVASYVSGSLSIISALIDSAVDITSGLVIYLTSRAIKKRDPYSFPRGRTRLEPLALIIVSVVMGIASIQLIIQSVTAIVTDVHSRPANCSAFRPHNLEPHLLAYCHTVEGLIDPLIDATSICIMLGTVVIKFTLVIICRRFKNDPTISMLAMDHRNDCISNLVALACAFLATKLWIYLDPLGAVLVSIYILYTWFQTGMEHTEMLSGKAADPNFTNRIIAVCLDHDPRVQFIDTVHVYHFGTRYLVEVDIVLDEVMPLKEAHDIGEELQANIESLPEVERAFVHLDYEYEHTPDYEHKVV